MFRAITILALVGLSILSFTANASHFMGGQITYKCVGSNNYEFTLKLYRDCNGCNPQTVPCQGFVDPLTGQIRTALDVTPALPNSAISVDMPLLSINDITPLCPSQTSRCTDPASSFPFGIQEYVFQTVINIPAFGGPYTFSHQAFARNAAITTLDNAATMSWYIYAQLDPQANCNSSPDFLNAPTSIVCNGVLNTYNHNAFDADGDSLVYSFVPAKQTSFTDVVYNSGYSASNFIMSSSPITLNAVNGEITYTPSLLEIGVLSILVEEYRGGVKIGEVVRDLQVAVQNCNNQIPDVRPLTNGGKQDTIIYAGRQSCIPFKATDADFTDPSKNEISLSVTGGIIPPATWSNPSPANVVNQGNLCWTPDCDDIRSLPYIITVLAEDNNCPLPGIDVATFEIYVREPYTYPPDINCVRVRNATTLEIGWINPVSDTIVVDKTYIYRSTNKSGPYALVDSVNFPTAVYFDSGLSPSDSIYYYYLTSGEYCSFQQSGPSDTVSNIRLSSNFVNPFLTLDWNHPDSSFFGTYTIRRFNGQSYYDFDTTSNLTYVDSITICTPKYLEHYVELVHPNGCVFNSNTVYDTVPGTDFPNPPLICKAEVNLDNSITIYYNADTPNVSRYYVYRLDPTTGYWPLIDSVPGMTMSWTDNSVNASQQPRSYRMSLRDTCGLFSGQSAAHKTVEMSGTAGQMQNEMSWNHYEGWSVARYAVYRGQSFPLDSIGQTTDTTFTDTDVGCEQTYIYRIMAIGTGAGSCYEVWGDTLVLTPYDSVPPVAPELCNLTIDPNHTDVTVIYGNSASTDADSTFLYRTYPGTQLVNISDASTSGLANYTDIGLITSSNERACFSVATSDTCGNESDRSRTYCTIDLSGKSGYRENLLTWTPFTLWAPDRYNVYGGTVEPLTFLGSTTVRTFSHSGIDCDQTYIYRVQAERTDPDCFESWSDTVHANCADIRFPNVFTPNGDGRHDVFEPIVAEQIKSMDFTVFNRWGQIVFHTNDPRIIWDGTANNGKELAGSTYYFMAEVGLWVNQEYLVLKMPGWVKLIRE